MKVQSMFLLGVFLVTRLVAAASLYNCASPRPEVAGFHNMVLFGTPEDQLYVYHLPLFAGGVNGAVGHVLMHVYQGLWKVQLDSATKTAYDRKFLIEKTSEKPLPFFTIGPKGNRFKVPDMICNPKFAMSAATVYGHIENNSDFPPAEKLVNQLSTVTVEETTFARRFNGSAKSALTYIVFGTRNNHYMLHFLTDDESSFDQILSIEIMDAALKAAVENGGATIVTVPVAAENGLVPIADSGAQSSPNNKWKIPVLPLGKTVTVVTDKSGLTGKIKIVGEIYFNGNEDLKK